MGQLRKLIKQSKLELVSWKLKISIWLLFLNFIYLDDTPGIESLIKQGINISAGFGDSLYYKPIHLAAELGKKPIKLLF